MSTADSRVALDLSLDWVVLAYTVAIALLTVLFFGTVPAFRAMQVPPIEALKANGADSVRAAGAFGRLRVRDAASGGLVVAQVAVSLVLMTGAGLFVRTFERLAAVPLGFDPARVLVVNVDTSRATTDAAARLGYHDRLVDEVRGVSGVAGAAASMWTPLSGGGAGLIRNASGRTVDSERVLTNFITPSWFAVYGIDITAGRDFDDRDTANALPVAIVNQAFARRFLPGREPVGERVRSMGRTHRTTAERTIVGVAADAAFSGSLRDGAPAMMYVPLAQSAGLTPPGNSSIRISVRSGTATWTDLPRKVGPALTAFDRDLAFSFRGLPDYLNASLAQERLIATMSGFFGALALLLAAVGLYGVTAYTASRRGSELGVRMALGAPRSAVIGLVLRQTLALTAIGIVLGLGGAAAASRSVEALLFGITPLDPATFAAVAVIFAAVAGVAAFVPAFRASRADPLVSLRCE